MTTVGERPQRRQPQAHRHQKNPQAQVTITNSYGAFNRCNGAGGFLELVQPPLGGGPLVSLVGTTVEANLAVNGGDVLTLGMVCSPRRLHFSGEKNGPSILPHKALWRDLGIVFRSRFCGSRATVMLVN